MVAEMQPEVPETKNAVRYRFVSCRNCLPEESGAQRLRVAASKAPGWEEGDLIP
jgi:hypothetical protein